MNILGLSAGHDSNMCVVRNGKVILHAEKERFTRKRYDAGAMDEFIVPLLASIGLAIHDINHIAVVTSTWSEEGDKRQPLETGKYEGERCSDAMTHTYGSTLLCNHNIPTTCVPHHLSHVSYAYYLSPFPHADIVSIDGGGNFTTGLYCRAQKNIISLISDLKFQQIAWIWDALSARLFGNLNAAGKVMGLAPFGEPKYTNILVEQFGLQINEQTCAFGMKEYPNHNPPFFFPVLGKNPHKDTVKIDQACADMAASLQLITNKMLEQIISQNIDADFTKNVCLTGGLALNCVTNQYIRLKFPNIRLFVGPAPNDSGLSIGAALYHWHNLVNAPVTFGENNSPFLGRPHSTPSLSQVRKKIGNSNITVRTIGENELSYVLANALCQNRVVSIHKGRSESGPRALGNRSILANPKVVGIKDRINLRIKFREDFRPFAPVVTPAVAESLFNSRADSPYMSFAPYVEEQYSRLIPGAIHIDRSARVQVAEPRLYPFLYSLLVNFKQNVSRSGSNQYLA